MTNLLHKKCIIFGCFQTRHNCFVLWLSPSPLPRRSALTWVTLFYARACLCMSTVQYGRWWYATSLFANRQHTKSRKRERKLLFMFAIVQVQNTSMESTLLLYPVSCFFVCIYSVQPCLFSFKSEGQIADPLPCFWARYMYALPWLHICVHAYQMKFEVRHVQVRTQAHSVWMSWMLWNETLVWKTTFNTFIH